MATGQNKSNVGVKMVMISNYSAGAIWDLIADQYIWCRENLPDGKWIWDHHMGAFHFEDGKDYMWFRLRWS